jgi:hypothetical protein
MDSKAGIDEEKTSNYWEYHVRHGSDDSYSSQPCK